MQRQLHNEPIHEYPKIYGKDHQVVGYCNECRYAFQCGVLKCLCLHPDLPNKYCFFGWYTAGLIPDALCGHHVHNEHWRNISISYFVNREHTIKDLIAKGHCTTDISPDVYRSDAIAEFVHKPLYIFIVGIPKDYTNEQLQVRWPWLKVGINKSLIKINPTTDHVALTKEVNGVLEQLEGIGHIPCLILEFDADQHAQSQVVIKLVKDREDLAHVNIATRLSHAELIQSNEILNLANLNRDIWAYNLRDIFKGRTIMCIAGGPSLNGQLDIIKANRDHYAILAVSTVAEALLKHGITPDIIGTIDMKDHNVVYLRSLTNEQMQQMYLMYEADANAAVVDTYAGPRIMLCADVAGTPILSILSEYVPDCTNQLIHKSGTVANLIYQFAKYLGAKRIILAGYDMCYRTDVSKFSHLAGTRLGQDVTIHDGQNGGKFIQQGTETRVDVGIEMPCNDGVIGITGKAFYTYLLELNIRVGEAPIVDTVNVSPTGLVVTGVPYRPILDVMAELHNDYNPTQTMFDILNAVPRKVVNAGLAKRILKSPLERSCSNSIIENHKAQLTFIARQYAFFPQVKHGNVTQELLAMIHTQGRRELSDIIAQAMAKRSRLNEEN